MANKLVISLLVVTLAANGVLGYFAYTQQGDINALIEGLSAARQEAAAEAVSQAEQLEMAREEITSLINENATHITGLEEGVEANMVSINEEAGRVASLGSSLSSLSGKVSNIVPGLAADEIYKETIRVVVEISDGQNTVGAGFIYDDEGHVVTAYHVIEDLNEIYVILSDGTISPASIVGNSMHSDISMLGLEQPTTLAPAKIVSSSGVAVGDYALVIGHPFDDDNSLTVGVVSHLNRFREFGGEQDAYWLSNLIQFDAPANFGNSGGPVFSADGVVIGMVIGAINPLIGDGISYAVSSNKIKRVADDIITDGEYRYTSIGVWVTDVTPAEAEAIGRGTVRGALVKNLVPRIPDNRDIIIGDIIVAVNNVPIEDVAHLVAYLGEHVRYGYNSIAIRLVRDGTEIDIKLLAGFHTIDKLWKSSAPNAQTTPMPSI